MAKFFIENKAFAFAKTLTGMSGRASLSRPDGRLEALLSAFPGEYCAFHADGSVLFSDGFCRLFGLQEITKPEDIYNIVAAGDCAALTSAFEALETRDVEFILDVVLQSDDKILQIHGRVGRSSTLPEKYRVLWAEDVSAKRDEIHKLRLAREAAEKRGLLFEKILEALPVAVWMRDASGDLGWVNHSYASTLGASRDDVYQGQLEMILSPKGRPLRDMARDALTLGKKQSETTHVIVGGKRRLLDLQESPLPGTHMTYGTSIDKTAEEDAFGQLERHRNATKILLEQLRTAVAFFSANQTLEFFNSAFSAQWELEEEWLNQKPKIGDILEKLRELRQLPEQADFRKYKQGWLDMFRMIDPLEEMLYLPNGTVLRMLSVPHPMGGLMMTFEDVTSRLELESSYNTLMAVQRETLDNLAEGVVVYGGDGRLRLFNPSFARIWQIEETFLQSSPHIGDVVSKKEQFFSAGEWATMRHSLIEQGLERTEQEGRLYRQDGTYLRYTTVPLPDGAVMASYYDVTDAIKVETALRDKNDALEAAEQLKTDFLANVSYQLRTPLSAIMGFAEIMDRQYFGPLNERQKEYTDGILKSGVRLVDLIDDILDLSSIEAGYFELKKSCISVYSLLKDLQDLVADWARKQNLTIKLDCPENIGEIKADERRLKQALLKLVQNSIKFTPEKGIIILKATRQAASVRIEVIDNGIGMSVEDKAKLFQPFTRTTAAKAQSAQSGAGLGLALVKNIVELHGGQIDVESQINKGTIMTLSFDTHQTA